MIHKDIISKSIFKRIFIDVATYLFHLDLREVELLDTEQQRVEDRRADLVASVVDGNGMAAIVHLEIQNQNHPLMPDRMLRYLSDLRFNYPGQNIRQYLLYIGKAPLAMADGIESGLLSYRYPIVDMHNVDYRFFMRQNSADAWVLAVLCDFKDTEPRAVLQDILTRLKTWSQDDAKALREYLSMLEILASNRDLNVDIQQEFAMIEVEIERLPSFLLGEQRGIREGIEQGMEQGIEQGAHDKALAIAKQLQSLNFPLSEIARITGLPVEELASSLSGNSG